MKKLDGKGFCIQSVRDVVRQYDNLAKGSRSFERFGDRVFMKGSGSSERVANGVSQGGDFADNACIVNMAGNRQQCGR